VPRFRREGQLSCLGDGVGPDSRVDRRRGGAAILKVRGTKHDSRAERAKKIFLYPHFSKCVGYKQANVSFEYIEICCLIVALINMS